MSDVNKVELRNLALQWIAASDKYIETDDDDDFLAFNAIDDIWQDETSGELVLSLLDESDSLQAERDQLRAELAAIRGRPSAELIEAVRELIGAANTVNRSRMHEVRGHDDDQPRYWQRKEWVDWLVENGEKARQALDALPPQQPDAVSVPRDPQPHDYRQDLQCWFGLDRASWCTIPRVLMEAMPEEWQRRAAILLHEYSEAFPGGSKLPTPYVQARVDGKITKWPSWINNYRHPDRASIESLRISTCQAEEGE
ncbi:hypothetical protein [Pseudomonas sp. USHLN015]|uniref:hypothetical protein n=1 Tax=Pseudomonas sp. USHLN015 TaxID=3081296 RepID=UPI00301C9B92